MHFSDRSSQSGKKTKRYGHKVPLSLNSPSSPLLFLALFPVDTFTWVEGGTSVFSSCVQASFSPKISTIRWALKGRVLMVSTDKVLAHCERGPGVSPQHHMKEMEIRIFFSLSLSPSLHTLTLPKDIQQEATICESGKVSSPRTWPSSHWSWLSKL